MRVAAQTAPVQGPAAVGPQARPGPDGQAPAVLGVLARHAARARGRTVPPGAQAPAPPPKAAAPPLKAPVLAFKAGGRVRRAAVTVPRVRPGRSGLVPPLLPLGVSRVRPGHGGPAPPPVVPGVTADPVRPAAQPAAAPPVKAPVLAFKAGGRVRRAAVTVPRVRPGHGGPAPPLLPLGGRARHAARARGQTVPPAAPAAAPTSRATAPGPLAKGNRGKNAPAVLRTGRGPRSLLVWREAAQTPARRVADEAGPLLLEAEPGPRPRIGRPTRGRARRGRARRGRARRGRASRGRRFPMTSRRSNLTRACGQNSKPCPANSRSG